MVEERCGDAVAVSTAVQIEYPDLALVRAERLIHKGREGIDVIK